MGENWHLQHVTLSINEQSMSFHSNIIFRIYSFQYIGPDHILLDLHLRVPPSHTHDCKQYCIFNFTFHMFFANTLKHNWFVYVYFLSGYLLKSLISFPGFCFVLANTLGFSIPKKPCYLKRGNNFISSFNWYTFYLFFLPYCIGCDFQY